MSKSNRSKTGRHLTKEARVNLSAGLKRFRIPSVKRLKRKYTMTQQQWLELKRKQNDSCVICNKYFLQTPCVDHNHKTGKIRGLLCHRCNRALGSFENNAPVFLKYLKQYDFEQFKVLSEL